MKDKELRERLDRIEEKLDAHDTSNGGDDFGCGAIVAVVIIAVILILKCC